MLRQLDIWNKYRGSKNEMKRILIYSISLLLLGCGNNNKEERDSLKGTNSIGMTREEYMNSLDSVELQNSLVFWAPDTAFATNADLLLLLDTLYQHVRMEDFPSEVKMEEKWMADYRSRLVAYYDSSYGKDTLSIFAKADSVLNEGERLLELGCSWTTMEMIVNNDAQYTLDRCREYGLLTQLINNCETDEAKKLVYKEWALYERMLKKIGLIAANMVTLNYWGGSISGPLRIAAYLQLSQSRRNMYQTLLNIVNSDGWDATGVYPENAKRLRFDSFDTAIKRIEKEADKLYAEFEGKERNEGFDETIIKTKSAMQELKPIVDEWIVLLDKLDDALTRDGSRHSVERAASYMLMKWASIVTDN